MTKPFHGARLKIERAKQHIVDVHLKMRDFLNRNSYVVYVESEPDGTRNLVKVEASLIVPDEFMLVVGDALHNLRSALDFAIGEIEFATTGERAKFTKFPVRATSDELKAAIKGGLEKKCPLKIIDFIIETVQPYQRGKGDILWCLNDLDIEDKHRVLIAKVNLTHIRGIRAKDENGTEFSIPNWLVVDHHVASYRCTGHTHVKITNQGKAMFGISFGDGLPLQGQLILPTLTKLSEVVTSTLDGIEAIFLESRDRFDNLP